MRISYKITGNHESCCDQLEGLLEGVVQAMMVEIAKDKDRYPCCIRCGDFMLFPAPGCPLPNCVATDASERTLHVRSASEILLAKGGSTIDLACYQCAQKRRDFDPLARVVLEYAVDDLGNELPGMCRAMVLNSDQHEKPEKRGQLDDPLIAVKVQSCSCDSCGSNGPG